jgi:hypothetical protein
MLHEDDIAYLSTEWSPADLCASMIYDNDNIYVYALRFVLCVCVCASVFVRLHLFV